jgi:7,8-dihydropterin-6-yl-methyl-4-(beta-D-ribofuranosyl)aminobenzene 5'-phosphate synthase
VLETENGLVIFNSCSHAGPDNIIAEVSAAFPGKKICALIGGLHLYKLTDEEVRAFADRLRKTGVKKVLTGHCTGDRAFVVLKEELGETVEQLYTGMEIEV